MKRSKQAHKPFALQKKVVPQMPISPYQKKLSTLVREQKGKRISYAFVCDKCGNKHISGYLFTDSEGNEYEICKYCCKKHDYMTFFSTPMGD